MAGTNNVFQRVGNLEPDRNLFNLSHTVRGDYTFGYLYPVCVKQCVPGDVIKMAAEMVVRLNPMVVPISHEINVHLYSFFVPYRILDEFIPNGSSSSVGSWPDFESLISGGYKGTEQRDFPRLKEFNSGVTIWRHSPFGAFDSCELCDYLGIINPVAFESGYPSGSYSDFCLNNVLAYPVAAYNCIYVNYFADENLELNKFENSSGVPDKSSYFIHTNLYLQLGNWDKDYFSSALPFQQRGVAPALPVSIFGEAGISGSLDIFNPSVTRSGSAVPRGLIFRGADDAGASNIGIAAGGVEGDSVDVLEGSASGTSLVSGSDFSATTFNVSDMRVAFQIQKFMERNARAGVRYTEFIKSHFGVSPTDARLDRPEYLGGMVAPVVISEVLQTAPTGASVNSGVQNQENILGDYAGHGISASRDEVVDEYHVEEFGCFMTIMLIKPDVGYMQETPREWLYHDRYDWYFPEFAHLSEQAIMNVEIFSDTSSVWDKDGAISDDSLEGIFAYQGRYDELRVAHDRVCGNLRGNLDYWTLSRKFSSAPKLNTDFIKINPYSDGLMRSFAVQGSEDSPVNPFIVSIGFDLSMLRPLPFIAEPGLIDHF